MPEIVKEADFNSFEDSHRMVKLSGSYGKYGVEETLVALDDTYNCVIHKIHSERVEQLALTVREMDALCEAWTQFKTDVAVYKAEQQAKQEANPSYGDPFLSDEEAES